MRFLLFFPKLEKLFMLDMLTLHSISVDETHENIIQNLNTICLAPLSSLGENASLKCSATSKKTIKNKFKTNSKSRFHQTF